MNLIERIAHLHPCPEAREWLKTQDDPQAAWDACENGSWMLWLIGKMIKSEPWNNDRKPLLACCLDCVLTVKHLWPKKAAEKIVAAVAVLKSGSKAKQR